MRVGFSYAGNNYVVSIGGAMLSADGTELHCYCDSLTLRAFGGTLIFNGESAPLHAAYSAILSTGCFDFTTIGLSPRAIEEDTDEEDLEAYEDAPTEPTSRFSESTIPRREYNQGPDVPSIWDKFSRGRH